MDKILHAMNVIYGIMEDVPNVTLAAKQLQLALMEEGVRMLKEDISFNTSARNGHAPETQDGLTDNEARHARNREKIQAIKLVRERKNWGLSEAKEYIDAWIHRNQTPF